MADDPKNILKVKLQEAYDTESGWSSLNPVLLKGQIAISSDKGMYKTGDGEHAWSALSYNKALTLNGLTASVAELNYVKNVNGSIQNQLDQKAANTHTHSKNDILSIDATKLVGKVPLDNLPAGALERCVVVTDDTARFKLLPSNVQLGDTVKVAATGRMYLVTDESKLSSEDGYTVYSAGSASVADRVGKALTIKLNNTSQGPWDGSNAKEINITPAIIGASASGHTHNYAGSSSPGGAASKAMILANYFSSRPTSANLAVTGDGGVKTFVSTSSMTEGKPPWDGNVLHFEWDNTGGWSSQLAISTNGETASRGMNSGSWTSWRTGLDSSNYTTYTVTKTGSGANGTWGINISGTAAKATNDSTGQNINTTYIKNITGSGTTITFTKGNGTTGNVSISDTRLYQSATTTADYRPFILGTTSSSNPASLNTAATGQAYVNNQIYAQPSTGTVCATALEAKASTKIGKFILAYDETTESLNFNFS